MVALTLGKAGEWSYLLDSPFYKEVRHSTKQGSIPILDTISHLYYSVVLTSGPGRTIYSEGLFHSVTGRNDDTTDTSYLHTPQMGL